jgi:hypothetical protein
METFCKVEIKGLNKQTKGVKGKNPIWNEALEFSMGDEDVRDLTSEISVWSSKNTKEPIGVIQYNQSKFSPFTFSLVFHFLK